MVAALIYNSKNILVRVEERPNEERAIKAGNFFTRNSGWFQIITDEEHIELMKDLINM